MRIPGRKFFTECVVSLCTSNVMILTPDQLFSDGTMRERDKEALKDFHIYLICRRPNLFFEKQSFTFEKNIGSGFFIRQYNDGKTAKLPFSWPFSPPEGHLLQVSDYPHKEIQARDPATGEVSFYWPSWIVSLFAEVEASAREFEVIYVGQAFGDGTRTAFDRLRSHSTLQRILADVNAQRPSDEILLFLFKYEPYRTIASLDGISEASINDDEDSEHFQSILENPLSEKQQIAIAEAGLIRYFNPIYNEKYKSSFPKATQKILKECYALDFSGLVVEINTEDVRSMLWSRSMRGGHHHIAKFDFHDIERRRSFFSYVDRDGRYTLMNDSGPCY